MRSVVGLPRALTHRDNAVLRPRDTEAAFGANPWAEVRRLVANGVLLPLAPGYYAIVPRRHVGGTWRPDVDAVALGIAQADYGADEVALTNVSAARRHAAIPRALAVAAVAVPTQRPPLRLAHGATVYFAKRAVDRLDVEAVETEVTDGWVTTREQTLLDLAARPTWGGLDERQAAEAITSLARGVDWDLVSSLATPQRKVQAMRRARRLAGL